MENNTFIDGWLRGEPFELCEHGEPKTSVSECLDCCLEENKGVENE